MSVPQYWLLVGTRQNWNVSFENGNIWGLKEFREVLALWNMLREGDKLLLYVSKPVTGIVGIGTVRTKFRQTTPLWPQEVRDGAVIWPLRFEFDIEYCLSPAQWNDRCYRDNDLQLITRMVFQCVPITKAIRVRQHFALPSDLTEPRTAVPIRAEEAACPSPPSHEEMKARLRDIGTIQGFVAEEEYAIEGNRLDVVWRRVQRSVPTYAFEVQLAGDVYHALAKLKRAYELWNSHIFLVARADVHHKFQELLSGTFHEIGERIRFLDLASLIELHKRKMSYKELERQMGILA